MQCSECVRFYSGQGVTLRMAAPAKRSNAAMDENGRAMDIVFPSIMGIYSDYLKYSE